MTDLTLTEAPSRAATMLPSTGAPPRAPYFNASETFGPTIQGEGRNAGQVASFVRLALCNLACSWCDSKYTWDWEHYDRKKEVHKVTLEEMLETVDALPGRLVVTGGEPLSQAKALGALLAARPDREWDVETNGTKALGATAGLWSTVTTSPKIIPSASLPGVMGEIARKLDPSILEVADFKFVVHGQADLDAVDAFAAERDLPASRIWLMPEGVTPDSLSEKTPWLMQAAVDRLYNFSSRLHVYGWYDVRGH